MRSVALKAIVTGGLGVILAAGAVSGSAVAAPAPAEPPPAGAADSGSAGLLDSLTSPVDRLTGQEAAGHEAAERGDAGQEAGRQAAGAGRGTGGVPRSGGADGDTEAPLVGSPSGQNTQGNQGLAGLVGLAGLG